MTENKIKELFEKSQKIKNMMTKLGIKEYHGYFILDTAVGKFLVVDGIPITSSLSDSYLGNDFSKFMPRTTFEIMEKFEEDIENNLFLELENFYSLFTKKC
ncbi:hypothetical protein [Sebaldella sp. S0638]|uniref:hypothetical protein n=1 Tax=Sebaldella sp. S0638 TaxID=2957809 RepID=UPI00209CFB9C|nr:hypothetical protein [Sebaldella sp. S0638]MCP1226402.1 hypothetical protein [Sebaldella sp. S0638]